MTDHKFTDDEIINMLKHCIRCNARQIANCDSCPLENTYPNCDDEIEIMALDLIKRQKVEIESLQAIHADAIESLRLAAEANKDMQAELQRLNKEVDRLSQCVLYHDGIVSDLEKDVFNAKAEAIKEFAQRLIDKCTDPHWCVWMNEIEDLVTEMTENKR